MRRVWEDPAGRFLIRCPVVTALMFVVAGLLPSLDRRLIDATLHSLGLVRLLTHSAVRMTGSAFTVGSTTIQIVPDCTPMSPILLLVGGILAFPASWHKKVTGALAGVTLLWVYNLARIYVLMAVLRFAPAEFDLVHVYLWQTATLLLVVGSFLLWIRWSGAGVATA